MSLRRNPENIGPYVTASAVDPLAFHWTTPPFLFKRPLSHIFLAIPALVLPHIADN